MPEKNNLVQCRLERYSLLTRIHPHLKTGGKILGLHFTRSETCGSIIIIGISQRFLTKKTRSRHLTVSRIIQVIRIIVDLDQLIILEVQSVALNLMPPLFDQACMAVFYCLLYTSPSPRDRQKSRM